METDDIQPPLPGPDSPLFRAFAQPVERAHLKQLYILGTAGQPHVLKNRFAVAAFCAKTMFVMATVAGTEAWPSLHRRARAWEERSELRFLDGRVAALQNDFSYSPTSIALMVDPEWRSPAVLAEAEAKNLPHLAGVMKQALAF